MKAFLLSFVWMIVCTAQAFSQDNAPEVNEAFDQVESLIHAWNNALDQRDYAALEKLYADTAIVYSARQSRAQILAGKRKWLARHSGYRQQIIHDSPEVYLKGSGRLEYVWADFQKIGIEGARRDTFRGRLIFHLTENGYKIDEETDATTIRNLLAKRAAHPIADGDYCWEETYWNDVRNSGLGHPGPIRRTFTLNYTVQDGRVIEGEFSYYSGFARMLESWDILQGLVNSQNQLVMEVQYIDIVSMEPSGAPATVIAKMDDHSLCVVRDTDDFFTEVVFWGGVCDD